MKRRKNYSGRYYALGKSDRKDKYNLDQVSIVLGAIFSALIIWTLIILFIGNPFYLIDSLTSIVGH